jgi:hypothetical protein
MKREPRDGPEPEIVWRVHPAAERKGMAALVLVVMLALGGLAGAWMRGPYWGVFAFGVLFLSLESFFLPTRFGLGPAGVLVERAFSRSERPWGSFRSAWFDPYGVTLSPYPRRHWLETYRALRLRFGRPAAAPTREAVTEYLLAHLDHAQVRLVGAPPAAGAPQG